IIVAQPQRPADVHQDELCPPNKRYALIDANKKVDLKNLLCRDKSRILADILKNHPLRFSIVASSSVPWIYLGTIFHLPQAIDNNHDHFVPTPTFSRMVPFYINNLCFTLELRSTSNFKTTGLLQPWQTLCKMFSRCLTTYVTFYDQPSNPTTMIPYPRFTKLIVSLYMTTFLEILRRAHDRYHNLADDVMIKSIFNSGKSKGTHRITSAPRSPNPVVTEGESSAPRRSTIIRLHIPPRRSTRLTLPILIPTTDDADDLILQDKLQLVEGSENVKENVQVTNSPHIQNDDNQVDPSTRLEPKSDKESLEGKYVEEIRNTSSPTTIRSLRIQSNLISSDTEKLQELTETNPQPSSFTPSSSSPKSNLSATNSLLSLFKAKPGCFRRYKSFFQELQGRYGYLFEHLSAKFMPRRNFNEIAKNLEDIMMESLPKLVDDRIKNLRSEVSSQVNVAITNHIPLQLQKDDVSIWLALKIKFERLQVATTSCRPFTVRPSAKRQKTTKHGTFEIRGSSSGQEYESKPGPSTSGNQEQYDDFDFWSNSYAIDDDVIPNERVSQ
ncbi:hypothetical protein Tco_1411944, partial [Tanacetum coccineum]